MLSPACGPIIANSTSQIRSWGDKKCITTTLPALCKRLQKYKCYLYAIEYTARHSRANFTVHTQTLTMLLDLIWFFWKYMGVLSLVCTIYHLHNGVKFSVADRNRHHKYPWVAWFHFIYAVKWVTFPQSNDFRIFFSWATKVFKNYHLSHTRESLRF